MTEFHQEMGPVIGQELRQSISAVQQQSLRLLAMPIQDLEAYVDECLLNNPVLEMDTSSDSAEFGEIVAPVLLDADANDYYEEKEYGRGQIAELGSLFQQQAAPEAGDSLRSLLSLQAGVMGLPSSLEAAVKCLISALDADGYLRMEGEELCDIFSLSPETLTAALCILQGMEPRGVGARDLGECLRLQTPEQHPFFPLVEIITREHLSALAADDTRGAARALGIPEKEIRRVFGFLRNLNPCPAGSLDGEESIRYIVPDVLVEASGDSWRVRLNDQIYGGISINPYYERMALSQLPDEASRDYLRQRMQEAKELLHTIRRRHETLLQLAGLLIRYQAGFLHMGPIGLKPLTMVELAEEAGCHPSTISRAAAGKYIQTPRGVFPWAYFFPQALPTRQGRFTTDAYVRMRILKMVADEDAEHPLSDQRMTDRLNEEGICIARRTVAKYRMDCAIPPRSIRRRTR